MQPIKLPAHQSALILRSQSSLTYPFPTHTTPPQTHCPNCCSDACGVTASPTSSSTQISSQQLTSQTFTFPGNTELSAAHLFWRCTYQYTIVEAFQGNQISPCCQCHGHFFQVQKATGLTSLYMEQSKYGHYLFLIFASSVVLFFILFFDTQPLCIFAQNIVEAIC